MKKRISLTDMRIKRLKTGETLLDALPSLSVTKLSTGNKVVFRWHKRIRRSNAYPNLTLGSYPTLSINRARRQAGIYDDLAEQGLHPREYEEEQAIEEKKATMTLQELLNDYNMARAEFNSAGTIKTRNEVVQLVFKDYLNQSLGKLTTIAIRNRYNEWSSQRRAPYSKKSGSPYNAKNALRNLNALLNHAVIYEYLDKNPMQKIIKSIQLYKKPPSKAIYLHVPECEELIEGLSKFRATSPEGAKENLSKHKYYKETWRSWSSLIGYEVIEMLLFTGLRKGDVCRLKWEQVHFKGTSEFDIPHFEVHIQKNQEALFAIPMTKTIENIFKWMRSIRLKSPLVFPAVLDTRALPLLNNKDKMLGTKGTRLKKYKNSQELRVSQTTGYGSLDRVCENIEKLCFPNGFKSKKTNKFIPQLLRHNFATHARSAGLRNEEIKRVTGHVINQFNELGASMHYVQELVTNHKPLFEKVEQGILGNLYEDIVVQEDAPLGYEDDIDMVFDKVEGYDSTKEKS